MDRGSALFECSVRELSKEWPKDAVVLLTGASSGLGRELFEQLVLLAAEVHVILHPRHKPVGIQDLDFARRASSITFCDLSDPQAVENGAREIVQAVPSLDSLILCAGTAAYGPVAEVPWAVVDQVINTNYLANVIIVKECLARLRDQPVARVVGIGSGSALMGMRYGAPYTASKAALHNFFEALWAEYRGSSVRVLHVMPGYMETPFHLKQPRFGDAGPIPPTGKATDLTRVARSILKLARDRQGNAFIGRNVHLAYHMRYWCPWGLRAAARRYGY